MKTNNNRMTDALDGGFEEEALSRRQCVNPEARKELYAYISGTLESSESGEVEDHLLECRNCRDFFLIMLSVGDEARASHELRSDAEALTRGGAHVPPPDDFKKKWP
jgi:predicted anti-sigma-YlaC factor YlaD